MREPVERPGVSFSVRDDDGLAETAPVAGHVQAPADGCFGTAALWVPRGAYPTVRRALARARRIGGVVALALSTPGPYGGVVGRIGLAVRPDRYGEARRVRLGIRKAMRASALHHARAKADAFPPLGAAKDWRQSEVHRTARAIARDLGARAYREGWSERRLDARLGATLALLLDARVGGLGAPVEEWRDGAMPGEPPSRLLVPRTTLDAVVAEGKDPTRDPRTALAYRVSAPAGVFMRAVGDERATARLREVPDLVARFAAMRWLTCGPIAATLARAVVALEAVQFTEIVARKPDNLLDGGTRSGFNESWSYRLARKRPSGGGGLLLALRTGQRFVLRCASTAVVGGALFAADAPFPGVATLVWFLAGRRLWHGVSYLLWGKRDPSAREREAALVSALADAQRALIGSTVPVPVYRHCLVTAVAAGVGWHEAAWMLLAHTERRRETLWAATPDYE